MALQIQKHSYSKALAALFCKFFAQWKYPVCIIYGNPDTGKTDTAIKMAEIGLQEKTLEAFASNINTFGHGQKITSLEGVNFWFAHQTGNKLYILDEAGINDDTRSPLSGITRKIRHNVFIARKFKGHWVFILQDIKDLDTWKDSPLTGMIIKKQVFEKEFVAKVKCKWNEDLITIRDFPKATLPFDTLDIAPFTLEQELDESIQFQGVLNRELFLFCKGETARGIAKEIEKETGTKYHPTQVMRDIRKAVKELFKISTLEGQPKNQANQATV
jgi:hypothetical protein